jgi:rod shape-determining protein MreD
VTSGGRATPRIALLVVAIVVLQVSGLGPLRLLGGTPDLLPLLVAAVALYAGSVPAMTTGFAAGLLLDVAIGTNLGQAALVLTAVGYGVGRSCEVRPPAHALAPIPVAAAATAGYVVGYGAVSFMLQSDAAVSALVLREAAVTVLLGALLALPVFALVRRVLRPVLGVDPAELRRRRRAQPRETGPIGLRGLEI